MVNGTKGENSRIEGNVVIHTNTVEGCFRILKRGINRLFRHVEKHHLHWSLSEFDFRYNASDTSDGGKAEPAVMRIIRRRLMYRQ